MPISAVRLISLLFLFAFTQSAKAADSGFIENMPPLAPDGDRAGAMIWTKPGVDRTSYQKIMVEPITIFISPESDYKGLDAGELKMLADRFHEAVVATLEPEIAVVNKAGPGVMYMRAALTDVKLANKKRGILGYTRPRGRQHAARRRPASRHRPVFQRRDRRREHQPHPLQLFAGTGRQGGRAGPPA